MKKKQNFSSNREKILYAIRDPFYGFSLVLHKLARWINDEQYLKMVYYCYFRKKLNLKNPTTFNEKMQWLKLYDKHKDYTDMSDKAAAKVIAEKYFGEDFIVPTYGVWEHFEDINFDDLPNQFVLKCTHNSGGTVICRDKSIFDEERAKKILNNCLRKNTYWGTREYPYKDIKPQIIAEQFLDDGRTKLSGLTDYKFFCFNGKVQFLYVSQGLEDHSTAEISFFDLEGVRLPFKRSDFRSLDTFTPPTKFKEMVGIVREVAQKMNLPFIRIDLYEVYGHLYFSEFTFFPCSGMLPFEPEEWDYKVGEWLKLPQKKS